MSGTSKLLIGSCWSVAAAVFIISTTLALATGADTSPLALTMHGAARLAALGMFISGWGVLICDEVKRIRVVQVPARPSPSSTPSLIPNPKAYQLGIMEGQRRERGQSAN